MEDHGNGGVHGGGDDGDVEYAHTHTAHIHTLHTYTHTHTDKRIHTLEDSYLAIVAAEHKATIANSKSMIHTEPTAT